MANWWEYQNEEEYRKRKAEKFGEQARTALTERLRLPAPKPPEPEEKGDGGILGALGKVGEVALKPFELSHKYVAEPLYKGLVDYPALGLGTGLRMATALETPEEAWGHIVKKHEEVGKRPLQRAAKEFTTTLLDPSMYAGLGFAGKAVATSPKLAKLAPGLAKLEDIAVGGPLFRAGGKAVMAPFKAAARRLAPDIPKIGAEAAGDFRIRVYDLATDRKRLASAEKLTRAITEAVRPARAETEALYTAERGRRAARLEQLPAGLGEEALGEQAKILKGALPKAELRVPEVTQDDIFNLFEHINDANIPVYDKVAARNALAKLIGPEARERAYAEIPGLMEIARLQKLFGPEFAAALRGQRTLGQKAWTNAMEAINLPRAVLAAYDLSAPLRQGILLAGAQPKAWAKNLGPMVRAFVDEEYAVALNQSLRRLRPEIVEASGVHIAPFGEAGLLSAREEAMMSKFAGQIPGLRMSERAYVSYLNKLRRDVLLNEVAMWEKNMGRAVDLANPADAAELQNIGKWINILSGRGDLGKNLNQFAPQLGIGLFSPRLVASRFEAPLGLLAASPQARKMVAKGIVGFVGANLSVLGLMKMSGAADVELNPLSTDFGKIRIGRTRLDFFGGYQPMARYVSQLMMGKRKTTVAGEVYGIERKDVITDFIETKLSPPMGLFVDIMRGRTFLGEPLGAETLTEEGALGEQLRGRLTPMFVQDLWEAVEESGTAGAFMAVPGAFGASVMSYAWPAQKLDELSQEHMNQRWRDLNFTERKIFFDRVPEAKETYEELVQQGLRRGQEWAEGVFERAESDAELQARITQGLGEGASSADLARDYQAYRGSYSFTGDPGREPRDEEEALAMEYWAIKPEDFVENGVIDWDAFYDARDGFLTTHPGVKEMLDTNEELRWTEPRMRSFVQGYQRADDLRAQYYDIPTKLGMSPEEQDEAKQLVAQAKTLQQMNPGLALKRAIGMLDITSDLKFLALRYLRLPDTPERERFRREHPEVWEFFPPVGGAGVSPELVEATAE